MARDKKEKQDIVHSSRSAALNASQLVDALKKKFGSNIVNVASDVYLGVPRIPTGIFPLDYALGGGYAGGRIQMLFGKKSSGKSTVLIRTLASAQNRCARCWAPRALCSCGENREASVVLIDAEGTFEPDWGRAHGLDPSRLLLVQPEFAEQAIDIADALLRSKECDVLAVDSVAFLSLAKEQEESVEKEMPGNSPRLMGKMVRKFVSTLNSIGNDNGGYKPTILLVNQIRYKVGVMFGSNETVPGGEAIRYANSIESKHWAEKPEMDEGLGKPECINMRFKIEKNKTSPAYMEGNFKLYLSEVGHKKKGDIGDEDSIIDLSKKTGFLDYKKPSWVVLDREFKTQDEAKEALILEPEFGAEWRDSLMKVLLAI